MRWIIMFKGGVETQEFFSVEIARALQLPWLFSNEYEIYWYDLILQSESARMLRRFYEDHKTDEFYAFTFNFNGIAGEEGLYSNGSSFWNETGIPVVNMVVDHPLYYHRYENMIPANYVQISIDENHEKYLKRFCPDIKSGGFIPLGGTGLNEKHAVVKESNYLKIQDRPIDVVFTGNYTPITILRKHLEGMEQEYIDFYESILEEVKSNPHELVEAVAERRLKEELGNLTDQQLKTCMPNMMYVDLAVRFYYRGLAVAALADNGIKVHTYGAGWNMLECKHPENIIQGGSVDSLKCLEVISQSKLSLNVMPWFKAGAHDRIFNSMLNGAVCVSDGSTYINRKFLNHNDIEIYSLKALKDYPEDLAENVASLLADMEHMQEMADNAYHKAVKQHSWQKRAEKIADIIKDLH